MEFSLRKFAVAVLAAAGVALFSVGAAGCHKKTAVTEAEGDITITKTPAPTDGSLPTAHSGSENLAYIAAVLDSQKVYHSYGYTVTSASIATQVTRTWKDYRDGILLTSDITYSTMVKSGTQTCTVLGGEEGAEVYFRSSKTPKSSTTHLNAEWDEGTPTHFTEKSFNTTYGLLQTELSSYIINEDSIVSSTEVTVNGDGTFSQSFVLDPQLSTYYYQYGMKTRGGLAGYPEFESVELTATFDSSWRILTLDTHDVANVDKGIKVRSVSDTTTVFSYGEADFDSAHFAYYNDYFRQYVGDSGLEEGGTVDEELVLDVTNVLSNGFSKVLSGGDQFRVSARIGRNSYVGYLFAGLKLEDIPGTLNIKLSLGKDYDKQTLYVEYADGDISAYYGKDFALSANIAEVKLAVGQFKELIDGLASSIETLSTQGEGSDDMLASLMDSLVLEARENSASLKLDTADLLGTGLGVVATLDFGVSGNSITFRNCDITSLSLGGEKLDVGLSFKVSDDPVIDREHADAPADLADYMADIHSLLSSDLIKLSVTLDGDAQGVNVSALKGLNVVLDAYLDAEGITVGADLALSYVYNGSPISAKARIWYDYDPASQGYGTALIYLRELNGAPVDLAVRCDVKQLADGIGSLLTYSGAAFASSTDSLAGTLNTVFSADFSAILTDMYADNSKIKVGVNVDELLSLLGANVGVNFGNCTLVYQKGVNGANGGVLSAALPAIGFGISAQGADGKLDMPDSSDCLDLAYILSDIQQFADAELYKAQISFDGAMATGLGIKELAGLKANLTAYLDKDITVGANALVSYTYNGNAITVDLSAWYDSASGNVILKLNSLNGKTTELSMYVNTADLAGAVEGLIGSTGTTLPAGNLDLDKVLAGLLSADMSELIPELSNNANGVAISINADKLLQILGANVGITFGDIDLAYTHADIPSLTAKAAALGLDVSVIPTTGDITLPDIENALNISNVLADIQKFAEAELYKTEISFDGANATGLGIKELAGLKANLTAYLDKNITVGANAVVSYTYNGNTIKVDLSAWYDNASGNVILKLNSLNGKTTELSMYVNTADLSGAVGGLIGSTGTTLPANGLDLDSVIAGLLSADMSELIPELSNTANGVAISINADKLLQILGANVGITFGDIDLAYTHADTPSLTAKAAALGLDVSVIPASGDITLPDIENALNIANVLADIQKFAEAELYKAQISFDGAKAKGLGIKELAGLKADLTAYLDKDITVGANAVVSYTYNGNTITVDLSAWYDNASGNVILKLNSLNGKTTELSMYVNTADLAGAVEGLIGSTGATLPANGLDLDSVIAGLLSADMSELIPELSNNADGVAISINADKLLEILGANVGITFGDIDLAYTHADIPSLTAKAAALGLSVEVVPTTGDITLPDIENALNIANVLDDIQKFADAQLYKAEISFDGAKATGLGIKELAGLKANLTAYLDKDITIGANALVSYTYNGNAITVDLSAWYDNASGNVILKLNSLNGKTTELSMYVNTSDLAGAVEGLIGSTGATLPTNGLDLDKALAGLLSADMSELIPELSNTANGVAISINADMLLQILGANVGITFGDIDLAYTHADIPSLTAKAAALGLDVSVIPTTGDITLPDIENALNIADVLADIQKFADAELYRAEITFDGAKATGLGIKELAGLKADLTAYLDKDITVGANAVVSYTYNGNAITVDLSAWYDNASGNVILKLNSLNGKTTELSMYVNTADLAGAVEGLIGSTGTTLPAGSLDLDSVIAGLLSADMSELIPELSNTANGVAISINADMLLQILGANVGITFGDIDLAYTHADTPSLTAKAGALGLAVEVVPAEGSITLPDIENALNIANVLADIQKFAEAQLYKAEISFDGAKATGLGIKELAGLKADLTAYLDKNITVGANAVVSYTYNGNTITVDLSAWYDNASGNVILKLNSLNDKATELSMYVNTADLAGAVEGLIGSTGTTLPAGSLDLDKVLAGLLSADMSELIPELSNNANGVAISVNADKLLAILGANVGITFGDIDLAYTHADTPSLTAKAASLGLDVSVIPTTGDITLPDIENALNISNVLTDIQKFADAQLYKAEISFDGAKATGLGIKELAGLKADLTAYLDKDITVGANALVSYTYKNSTVTADISVWYDYDGQTMGNIYVTVNALNGVSADISVKCNIGELSEAIKTLMDVVGGNTSGAERQAQLQLEDVLSKLLAADFAKLLPNLSGNADGFNLSIDGDYLLSVLGANVGITFGKIDLAYDCNAHTVGASAPALGVSAVISTSEQGMEGQKPVNAQDLSDLVTFIGKTVGKVNEIIDGQRLWIAMDEGQTFVTADGITADIWGEAEISWNKTDTYVALDLAARLTESAEDVTYIKLIYRATPAAGVPMVRLVINQVGIDIYPDDIQSVRDGFAQIADKIGALLPENTGTSAPVAKPSIAASDSEALIEVLFRLLAGDEWVEALGDMSLHFDENSLLLGYLKDNALGLEIADDGALIAQYSGKVAGVQLGGKLAVHSGSASLISAIDNEIAGGNYKISSSADGNAPFARLVYDFLFDAISSVSIDGILGSDTYKVNLVLNGNNSSFAQLRDVVASAALYITGEQAEGGKVAEADVSIDVKGVKVELNVIAERAGGETYFYINLSQVLNFALPDLKVVATQSSLYETIAVLIKTVTDTDVIDVVGTLMPASQMAANLSGQSNEVQADDATAYKIAEVLDKLLNFNFSQAFVATRVDDVTTAEIYLDSIAAQLGFDGTGLGKIQAEINHKYHTIKTSAMADVTLPDGSKESRCWLSLSSEKTARRDYSSLNREEYINIEFLPSLLSDLVEFATDDQGAIYGSFTFSGTISAKIVSILNITIDISTLTFSYNEGQGLYFTLIGNLSGSMVTAGTIGITYQDGYLTLGKNLAGGNDVKPEYRVMTFAYFVDHMFSTDGTSTLNYLLGVGSGTWNLVISLLGDLVKLDSGLTTPEELFLYVAEEVQADEEISLYDYIDAVHVVVDGDEMTCVGDYNAIGDELGVYDNYYGVSLNAGVLTDGVLTKLVAAILRDDQSGISGIKAAGAIQSYVTFEASLDYDEGLTPADEYVPGTALAKGKYAPSLYKHALALADEAGVKIDFDHYFNNEQGGYAETFGCFNTSDMTNYYSHELYSHTLTIVSLDGSTQRRTVRHGSSIHTYDNNFPVYSADGMRVLYSLESGGDVCASTLTLNGDMTLWQVKRSAVNVYIVSGSEVYVVNSFAGDDVPLAANGMNAVGGVTYADGSVVQAGDKVPSGIVELWLNATLTPAEVVVNDVVYTFDVTSNSYVASGRAAGFNDRYSVKGETLVLESSINGYPVTAIADGAFAASTGKSVYNVVVPSSITYVGAGAFLDNEGMQSIVLLADSVIFGGTEDGLNTPFYGCHAVGDEASTSLNVYCNAVNSDGQNWRLFNKTTTALIFTKKHYIGSDGGAEHGAGSWDYVQAHVEAEDVTEFDVTAFVQSNTSLGLIDGKYDGGQALSDKLSAQLSQYKNEQGEDKYILNFSVDKAANGATLVTVGVVLNVPVSVTVYSPVDMVYNGQSISGGSSASVYAVRSGDGISLLPAQADGYVFLGWAAEGDDGFAFVEKSTAYIDAEYTYYAVWGTNKRGTAFSAAVNYGGTALSAPYGGGIDGKWYDDSWTEITKLSKDNTVLYSRTLFSLGISVTGGTDNGFLNKKTFYYMNDDRQIGEGRNLSYNGVLTIADGETYTVTIVDGKAVISNASGDRSATVYAWLMGRKNFFASWEKSSLQTISSGVSSFVADGDYTLSLSV